MFKYHKILIVGVPGSGKSTFSYLLAEIIKYPLFHMDLLYWKKNRKNVGRNALNEKVKKIIKENENFIIEGSYSYSLTTRLEAADLVFIFDLPTKTCLEGIYKRIGKPRNDLPFVEKKLDLNFAQYVKNYKEDQLKAMKILINEFPHIKVITFSSHEEVALYLDELKKSLNDFQ